MFAAHQKSQQDSQTVSERSAEWRELRKRLLEMILQNENLRRARNYRPSQPLSVSAT